jgi:pimeloyl-ACP methyl ester carboxylesterase
MTRRGALIVTLTVLTVSAAGVTARPFVHGLSLVVRAADLQGGWRRIADLDTTAIDRRELRIPIAGGSLRARVYSPAGGARRTVLLVTGLHPGGIDEPRLVRLAGELAASGVGVVTPEIPELLRFEISPAITDEIEQAAVWLAVDSGLSADGTIGMLGISFSGGLSLVAAGRPSLAGRVAYVFSSGGHHDLQRVLRYVCTGTAPYPPGQMPIRLKADPTSDGTAGGVRLQPDLRRDDVFVRRPHDYGVALILFGVADRLVPREQVAALREATRRFLWASYLDRTDRAEAAKEFAAAREIAKTLPEPSATLVRYVNDRDVVHLGSRLLPFIASFGGDPALSVSKSPKPTAPVFLLHGADDNVIPSIEAEYLADDLRGRAPVHLLTTRLFTHAGMTGTAGTADVLRLAGFWGDILAR